MPCVRGLQSGWLSGSFVRLCFALLLTAACLVGPAFATDRIKVVASFSILGDLVKNVGGAHVEVVNLVAPNGDPHVFDPSPKDAGLIADARLVVVNGLGLEGWLDRLIEVSSRRAPVIVATEGIKPRTIGVDRAKDDPHAWQSVPNVEVYVANIRDALIKVDTAHKSDYEANCAGYLAQLGDLDREIRSTVAAIPAGRRSVLTVHNAFGYFADAYGIAFAGLQGVSTDAEPSARDVAMIIRQIREKKIAALFVENIVNPAQLRRIADETGVKAGGTLYSDALTEASGAAPTYIDLMRHNIRTIGAALKD
jgi:zinc/manganese transport system substrate-binding protein